MNQYKTLPDILCAHREICDKGITIIHNQTDETLFSYQSLYHKALLRLHALQLKGIKPGDEIILQIDDVEDFIISFWAGLLGGFIMIPLAIPARTADEHYCNLLEIYRQMDNAFILTDTDILPRIRQYISSNKYKSENNDIEQKIEDQTLFINQLTHHDQLGRIQKQKPTDIAFVQYSSGSTGEPKGVVLTHENILSNIDAIIHGIKGTAADISLSWLPLTHDMGLIGFHLVPLAGSAHQLLMPVSLFARRPLLWLEKASQHQATVLGSPDFGLKLFLSAFKPGKNYHWDLSSIRLIFNGAEPINDRICTTFTRELKKYNLTENVIFPVYGLAEATLAVTFPQLNEKLETLTVNRSHLFVGNRVEPVTKHLKNNNIVRLVDVGSPVKDCQVRIVDSQFNDVVENTIGHILIKGKNVTGSYYKVNNNQKLHLSPGEWLDTGDLGFLRKGHLVVTGREKDMIIVNGRNYYLHDLERLAEQVEGISPRKSTICSIYNPVTQKEDLYVFLVYKKPLEELIPLWQRLTDYIYQEIGITIKYLIPVDRIPVTTSGKPMRHVLVRKYLEGEFSDTIAAVQKYRKIMKTITSKKTGNITNTEAQLLTIVSRMLNLDNHDINIHDNLNEYGVDSLKLPLLLTEVEKIYPNTIQLIDCFDHPTISELAALIVERKNSKYSTSLLSEIPRQNNKPNHNQTNARGSVQFNLDMDTSENLTDIARKENVPVDVVLLSLTINLFKQVYKKSLIRFHTFPEKNLWIPIGLDISHIEYFSDMLLLVNESLQEEKKKESPVKVFAINETNIPVFFYQGFDGPIDERVKNHDLVIIVKGDTSNQSFIFDFNIQRFPKAKIQHLAHLYLQLIQKLVDKFD